MQTVFQAPRDLATMPRKNPAMESRRQNPPILAPGLTRCRELSIESVCFCPKRNIIVCGVKADVSNVK
jgi:hypothetical protein